MLSNAVKWYGLLELGLRLHSCGTRVWHAASLVAAVGTRVVSAVEDTYTLRALMGFLLVLLVADVTGLTARTRSLVFPE